MELTAEVYKGGRVTIPKSIRKRFDVEQGSQLTFRVKDDQILLMTEAQLLAEARAALQAEMSDEVSLVDELLAERRAEVARENVEHYQDAQS